MASDSWQINYQDTDPIHPEQWRIGPADPQEQTVLYEGGSASIEAILEAFENIGSPLVSIAALGHSKYKLWWTENETDYGWLGTVTDTDGTIADLKEVLAEVQAGHLTNEEALQIVTENIMPDFGWEDVSSWAIAAPHESSDEEEDF